MIRNERKQKRKHPYAIGKITPPGQEKKEKVPEYMQGKNFPGHPTTALIVGQPGSGKTNLLMSLLTSPQFWRGYFDKIYLFGLTCKSDDLYKSIKLPDDQIFTDSEKIVPELERIIKEQDEMIKGGNWNDADKLLFVFEDFTSLYQEIQGKKAFIRCFCQIRHLKSTALTVVHKFKAMQRTARMCCLHIMCFNVNNTDVEAMYDDYGSSHLSKKEFIALAKVAMDKENEDDHPFFYINLQAPENIRYRRNFTSIYRIKEPVRVREKKSNKDSLVR